MNLPSVNDFRAAAEARRGKRERGRKKKAMKKVALGGLSRGTDPWAGPATKSVFDSTPSASRFEPTPSRSRFDTAQTPSSNSSWSDYRSNPRPDYRSTPDYRSNPRPDYRSNPRPDYRNSSHSGLDASYRGKKNTTSIFGRSRTGFGSQRAPARKPGGAVDEIRALQRKRKRVQRRDTGPIDRDPRIVYGPQGRDWQRIPHQSRAFFEINQVDFRRIQKSVKEMGMAKEQRIARLHTRKPLHEYTETTIRVRLSEGKFFECKFRPNETIGDLKRMLSRQGYGSGHLYVAPPRKDLDDDAATFLSLELVPAAIINIANRPRSFGSSNLGFDRGRSRRNQDAWVMV